MKDYSRREIGLAAMLSGVAGFVDAVGYLKLGGFFVSFMSGNSTRLGVGLGTLVWSQAGRAAGLIALFLVGVIVGALVSRRGGLRRGPVLAAEALLLIAAAGFFTIRFDTLGVVCLVLAMGVENAVFQRGGEVAVGLTYMTGALVKAGQRMAGALTGGEKWAWAPYLALWSALCLGAALGAAAYVKVGALSIWGAALLVTVLAARVALVEWVSP
jgi:uncharacterized membrane protein YoaK (UPF0700 family)